MATTEVRVHIDATPDQVFEYVATAARHPQWQDDLVSDTWTSGDGTAGTTGTEVRSVMGKQVTSDYEITEHAAPHRWAYNSLRGPVSTSGVITCTASGSGTDVLAVLTFGGWSGEVMSRFAKKQFTRHLERLRSIAEASNQTVGTGE